MNPMRRIVIAVALLNIFTAAAAAQNETAPEFRGVGVPAPTESPTFQASSGNELLRHRGPTGKPCLDVGGFARRHTTVANLYDHVIAIKNNCAQRIAIQVCYYNTQDCLPVEIPGGERKEAVLGTMPSMTDFRFEFREKF
jgi:hypothetical protein